MGDCSALARLRIGHTRLTHGYLMDRSDPPRCAHCDTQITVSHILLTCPLYTGARDFNFPHLLTLSRPPKLEDILLETPYFSIDAIMNFLDSIGILKDI